MPLDNGYSLKDSCCLKELEQSHVSSELADVSKSPDWEHEILKWNSCKHIVNHDSIDVVVLDLVKVCDNVRASALVDDEG